MIKNIKEFENLSFKSIREMWFKLKREKFQKNDLVSRFNQIQDYWYFVEKGSLMVYVWNEMTKVAHPLQKISHGGWWNLINSITGHSSIFIVRAIEEWILLKLHSKDLENLSKRSYEINEALKIIKTK